MSRLGEPSFRLKIFIETEFLDIDEIIVTVSEVNLVILTAEPMYCC